MSLAVVFDRGDEARVLAALDNDSCGQGCARLASALFSWKWVGGEVAHLLRGDGAHGFLELPARPVPVGCVVLDPARVGRAGNVFERFVNGEHCGWPFLRGRAYSCLLVVLYHVPVSFAYTFVLLLVARSVVNLAHHQSHHERVNAGNGAACGVSRDGDGGS